MSIFVDRNKLFIVQIVGRYIHDNNGNNIGFKIQKDGEQIQVLLDNQLAAKCNQLVEINQ